MKIAGITLVANGVELGYPFEACIRNLAACCDEVFVCTDTANRDNTTEVLRKLPKTRIIETPWNWTITMGRDLAYRANRCLEIAEDEKFDYALYVQADEIVDPREIDLLRCTAEKTYLNFAIERTYFWKDLNHINQSWTMYLPRLCALSYKLRVIEDGMSMCLDQYIPLIHIDSRIARIYHYSRVGESTKIATRLNTLDLLFHDPKEFTPLKDYIFGINNNFESGMDKAKIIEYNGSHPPGIEQFYNGPWKDCYD
jgi:hypothetical protein